MIINDSTNTATIPAQFENIDFGIDNEDFTHIVDILQNQLYSDKPLAIVREYSTNSYDAHIAAGKKSLPIRITLPSKFEPKLSFRDFGNGLTHEEMKMVFTRYGKSTKRRDNNCVGSFGIGCKCAWSYTSNFSVNSYQKGIKSAYSCVLTETKVGNLIVLNTSATTEPDGLEVIINIKQDDIDNFRKICIKFFKYWDVMPEIVGFNESDYAQIRGGEAVTLSGTGWKIMENKGGYSYNRNTNAVALMGNIGYPIKWESVKGLQEFLEKRGGSNNYNLGYFVKDNNLVFDFAIGEVKMSPSRETLQYTDLTNNNILARVGVMLDEVAIMAQKKIATADNLWNAKLMYDDMFSNLGGLSRLKGSIKVSFAGKTIEDNRITGFAQFIKDAVLKTYHRRGGNTNYYCYEIGEHSWNSIECKQSATILEVDTTKSVYLQKAVKYLGDLKKVSTVYVLTFKDAAQRQQVFDATGLNDSFITKYSTIADDVKNTIVRNTANGSVRVKKDTTIRSLKRIDSNMSTRFYYNNVREFDVVDYDLASGGIYVETDNNELKNSSFATVNSLVDVLVNVGKYTKQMVNVYFIGQNYMNGKLMNQGKWVKFDDYVEQISKDIVAKDKQLRMVAALEVLVGSGNVFEMCASFAKIIKDNKLGGDIEALANLFTDKKSVEKAIVRKTLVVTDDDKKAVKTLFDNVVTQFPLIAALNVTMCNYDDYSKEIIAYLKQNV
jgi:Histidine kinase-, DNA gyrase B-, and HSP90-like ATPase